VIGPPQMVLLGLGESFPLEEKKLPEHTIGHVLLSNTADSCSPVGHRLLGKHKLVKYHVPHIIDDGHPGQGTLQPKGSNSHHLTIEGEEFG